VEDEMWKAIRRAQEEDAKRPPKERFQEMVDRGVIDSEGRSGGAGSEDGSGRNPVRGRRSVR
jgi:hypothetical protein